VRERTRDGLPAPRAHTGSAARGQDREDRRRDVCVPRQRPCPGADRAHALAPEAAGTRTCMLQAACGPARPCVAPRHGRAGRRADARRPPQKQRTRWQLVPPRSARARRRRRRARPPRREAAASPLPVVAPMVRNLAEIVPKGPRAPGPATAKFVRPSPGRGPESTTVPNVFPGIARKSMLFIL
jgi:hypothetical protein